MLYKPKVKPWVGCLSSTGFTLHKPKVKPWVGCLSGSGFMLNKPKVKPWVGCEGVLRATPVCT